MTTEARKTKAGSGGAAAPATRMKMLIAALTLLAAASALAAPPAARADAAAGAPLYKDKCMGCHGADGSGSTPMGKALKVQDLRKPEIQAKKDAELAASITNGKGKMPAQKGNLSAAQVAEIVSYVRTLGKGK
ncbi:MAG TPA: cytochrome c [Thermoanaerobaculia bacterium]|nr:cytochrome c [Thermoanaerobaculia bacterium]